MNTVDFYSNKEVSFRFNGKNLSFFLSQSLFSSFDVDKGTRLLLKTLAQKTNPEKYKSLLDVGCGTGVLGLSIKKVFPEIEGTLQDRDALGVHFSRINAEKNNIKKVTYSVDLAFNGLQAREYDLVLSNLPAKAGAPVLESFIQNSLIHVSWEGLCAVVVVSPLKDFTAELIGKFKGEVIFKEDSQEYTVFHYKRTKIPNRVEMVSNIEKNYFRGSNSFSLGSLNYSLDTVFNVRGFDTIPYSNILFGETYERVSFKGHIFVWNPGQGHIPLFILSAQGKKPGTITLASRDVLENRISAHNITLKNKNIVVRQHTLPSPLLFTRISADRETYRWMIFDFTESLDKKLIPLILKEAYPLLEKDGGLIFTGKSSILSDAASTHKGFTLVFSRKYRSFRILILKKQ